MTRTAPVPAVAVDPNLPSKVSMLVIGVTNLEKSLDFYQGTLGLPVTSRFGGFAMFAAGGVNLLLNEDLGKAVKPTAGAIEILFSVDSVSASHRALAHKGCTFIRTPAEVSPGSWRAVLTDPDGHMLTVFGGK